MRWVLIVVGLCRWTGLGYGLQSPPQPNDGTYHFVSSAFPEVDQRGFYEHLFDDIGDYYPSWRRNNYKENPVGNSLDAENQPHVAVIRSKRGVGDNSIKTNQSGQKNSTSDEGKHSSIKENADHSIGKRSPTRHVRGMEMGSSGFHEDMFNSAFGDFITMRRRRMVRTALRNEKVDEILNKIGSEDGDSRKDLSANNKLSQAVFDSLRNPGYLNQKLDENDEDDLPLLLHGLSNLLRHGSKMGYFSDHPLGKYKRRPEMDSAGFHGDAFGGSFGDFDTMRKRSKNSRMSSGYNMYSDPYSNNWLYKRRPEMDSSGFHGDTFGGSFGDFDTMKKRRPEMDSSGFHGDTFGGSFGDFDTMKKRRPEMDSSGFHGDTFGGSFGEFDTMKKRRPEMDSAGFHGDTFGSFGGFDTMKKRRPEMDSSGFHGDVFGGSFGDFDTMKKRRPEMDSSGFHGDTFGGSFGDFDTMKKRRPEMDSAGFHGDMFGGSFGDFDTMKKRRPEMDSSGFHGDTFGGSFGDFDTMKKRRPEMDSSGFHGDTFGGSFGDFDTMKKRLSSSLRSELTKRSTNSIPPTTSEIQQKTCDCDLIDKPELKKTNKDKFDGKCLESCPKKN